MEKILKNGQLVLEEFLSGAEKIILFDIKFMCFFVVGKKAFIYFCRPKRKRVFKVLLP